VNEKLWERAERLAARNYDVEVLQDETTDGQLIFMARNPELPGCKAQGATIEEALSNLSEARSDYIYSLLEDGLSVPDPAPIATSTSSCVVETLTVEFADVSEKDVQPEGQELLYRASSVT
jgi:predicted RNase H-like HicB family nuclease